MQCHTGNSANLSLARYERHHQMYIVFQYCFIDLTFYKRTFCWDMQKATEEGRDQNCNRLQHQEYDWGVAGRMCSSSTGSQVAER